MAALCAIKERALLLTLAGIQFTHMVDFMVMMPLGPQFTQLFGISDAQFGLLVSAYTLAAGMSGVAASMFIDRFGRKTALLWLYSAFALSTLACGLAPIYALLMAARIAAGLFGGVMGALIFTIVGDAIPFERRGHAMGIVMTSFSLATVAGVPGSLWLAAALGWHASFIAIALVSVTIACVGLRTLPRLEGHLAAGRGMPPWEPLLAVVREPAHWRAFGFSVLLMATGFFVIPYVTIYLTANAGVTQAQVPIIYLAGGVATIFTSPRIGLLADRWGKVRMFRIVAALAMLPLLALTHLPQVPLWVTLAATTSFFVCMSGRMVPGMALVTSATLPALRGTFMSLNASLQSFGLGLASLTGGLLIGRDAQGLVRGYPHCGWLAVALSLLALWWVGRLKLQTATESSDAPAPDTAAKP